MSKAYGTVLKFEDRYDVVLFSGEGMSNRFLNSNIGEALQYASGPLFTILIYFINGLLIENNRERVENGRFEEVIDGDEEEGINLRAEDNDDDNLQQVDFEN